MHLYMCVFKLHVAGMTEYEGFSPCYLLIVVLSSVNISRGGASKSGTNCRLFVKSWTPNIVGFGVQDLHSFPRQNIKLLSI